jgi:hypothetical protein
MPVRIWHFGTEEDAVVEDVRDGGRTIVVKGEAYTLRRVNAHYVRQGEPPYGTRLLLRRPGGEG